jgi:hypothetical protein
MGKEYLLGQMVDNTLETIVMIKNKEMEFLYGLKEKDLMGNGLMENSMAKEYMKLLLEQ